MISLILRPLTTKVIKNVTSLSSQEKLELIAALKGMGLSIDFIKFIFKYFSTSKYSFQNYHEFSKLYPNLAQTTYDKIEKQMTYKQNGFNHKEKKISYIKFIRYTNGAKFFTSIIMTLISANLLSLSMLQTISSLFENTIVGSEGIFTKNFHSSQNIKQILEIRSPNTKDNNKHIYSIIYFKIKITSVVNSKFFVDSSDVTIEYEIKVKEFSSVNELIYWVSN